MNWPADKVERKPVADLIPYARNARTHSDEQVAQIAASIKEWGWTVPVLIDEHGGLIAGHGRVLAARKLGIEDVPVMVADGWPDAKKRAYILADNKLALNAGWDNELLSAELSELSELLDDVGIIGFDENELAALLVEKTAGETDPDEVPEISDAPVSIAGDLWILGKHRIICGDSTSAETVAALLGDVRPHLMVTDPPYGVEYDASWRADVGVNKNKSKLGKVLNDDCADWTDAWALFSGDVAYVWHGMKHAGTVFESLEKSGFEIRAEIVWAKDRFALSRGHYHAQHESCFYSVRRNAHWNGDRKQSTLWNIPSRDDSGVGHGTQKPVECMKRPIENNSSPGQAVYEPFSGSGTTIIACEMTGRHCYAIELNPAYVDVAVRRWQEFAGSKAVHEKSSKTFEEVMNERAQANTDGDQANKKKPRSKAA